MSGGRGNSLRGFAQVRDFDIFPIYQLLVEITLFWTTRVLLEIVKLFSGQVKSLNSVKSNKRKNGFSASEGGK